MALGQVYDVHNLRKPWRSNSMDITSLAYNTKEAVEAYFCENTNIVKAWEGNQGFLSHTK